MEQKTGLDLDLKYRLRVVRELASKLFLADEYLRCAVHALNAARDQTDLYFPEPHAPLPSAFKDTSKILIAYRDNIRHLRNGLYDLRERCYDTATDFRCRLEPAVINEWAPRIGRLTDTVDDSEIIPMPVDIAPPLYKYTVDGSIDFLCD
jgi:hypothetical protein